MPSRLPVAATAEPLEAFVTRFDDLFTRLNQRQAFRRYLEGLLLSSERNKTLTALANAEPIVGALHPSVQSLQFFLSESNWQVKLINARRKQLLRECLTTAPTTRGVLVIDETGDRKDGKKTAHVARQYLANLGKVDNGVVSVTSLYADEHLYYPLEVEPYTPSRWFEKGKQDTAFRTKPQIALELVQREVKEGLPFRAVVADCFYGENDVFVSGLQSLEQNAGVSTGGPIGFVLSLKRSHCWWHEEGEVGSLLEAARLASWNGASKEGDWQPTVRTFADGHKETWYALEVKTKAYHPEKSVRAVVATTDPALLPEANTWFLMTNLPAPKAQNSSPVPVEQSHDLLAPADLEEVVRLYSLRNWVEQSYKQVKHALGWAQYQVRSDTAMRRHWTLVMCAFSFVWWNHSQGKEEKENQSVSETDLTTEAEPVAEKKGGERFPSFLRALAVGTETDSFLAGPLDTGMASLAGVDVLATSGGVGTSLGKSAAR
jgi:SRSO17 transposase